MSATFPRLDSLNVAVILAHDGTCYVDRAELLAALERKRKGLAKKFDKRTKGEICPTDETVFAWDCEQVIESLLHQVD